MGSIGRALGPERKVVESMIPIIKKDVKFGFQAIKESKESNSSPSPPIALGTMKQCANSFTLTIGGPTIDVTVENWRIISAHVDEMIRQAQVP